MAALVLMDGGHSTYVPLLSVQEVEHELREAREQQMSFVYIQTRGDNQLVIDPCKVVAVVASRGMTE